MKADTKKILQGDQLAGAKLIRMLEEGDSEGIERLKTIFPHSGKAFVLGITGPPGCGKSTLITHIITEFRRRGMRVGVVAVDPSSPFSGGAFLGDRLRMRRHTEDPGRLHPFDGHPGPSRWFKQDNPGNRPGARCHGL